MFPCVSSRCGRGLRSSAGLLGALLTINTAATADPPHSHSRSANRAPLIYLLDGTAAGQTDIYAWRFGGHRLRRVTHDITSNSRLGVSEITGTPGGVVFDDSRAVSGDLSVGTINGLKVHRVAIGGVSRLYSPRLSNTGELAFSSLRRPNSLRHPVGTIMLRPSLGHGKLTTIVRQPGHLIADPTWNPTGTELAYSLYSAADYRTRHIVIVDDHGLHIDTIADPALQAGGLSWSPTTNWLGAFGRRASAFINTRTKAVRSLPNGWDFGCWQPDGNSALVINGNVVGLATPRHPGLITSKTTLPGHGDAFGCAYQPSNVK